jgi:HPt (histidine-containing phosphotransfer) domain-containing protein
MKRIEDCDPLGSPRNDLDWTQFEAITCGFSPEFIDVYREFESDLPQLFSALEKAIATSSFIQIINLAHQMKGSAANFGFIGTSHAMNELEQEAKKNSLKNAKTHLFRAQKAFQQAQFEVNKKILSNK